MKILQVMTLERLNNSLHFDNQALQSEVKKLKRERKVNSYSKMVKVQRELKGLGSVAY